MTSRDAKILELVRDIKSHVFPPTTEASRTRWRRTWLARTVIVLPQQQQLDAVAHDIDAHTEALLRSAYAGSVDENAFAMNRGTVELLRLSDFHCLVVTEGPERAIAVGHAIEVATFGALRAFAERLTLADLQGLPKEFWFEL